MGKRNVDDAIQKFLDNGGKVSKVRPANQKDVNRASRTFYHKDKAICGSERSKGFLKKSEKKESSLIFSRAERWKSDD
jgi:hypothetical protein